MIILSDRSNYSSGAPWESIAGYSRAVRIGNIIEVAGTTAVDTEGQVVGAGDISKQTDYIFNKIKGKMTLDDLLIVTGSFFLLSDLNLISKSET